MQLIEIQFSCFTDHFSPWRSVVSPIDEKHMKGIQSIKVHRGFELASTNHIIRWTEVFIIQVSNRNLLFVIGCNISEQVMPLQHLQCIDQRNRIIDFFQIT